MVKLVVAAIACIVAMPAAAASVVDAGDSAPAVAGQSNADPGMHYATPIKPVGIEGYIAAAKKYGYDPSILGQPGDKVVVLKLTKLGKTENGHGILQKKWDQRTPSTSLSAKSSMDFRWRASVAT